MSCNSYEIGQPGPFGKKIKDVIIQSDEVIVYMDEADTIQWSTEGYTSFHKDFGEVENKISDWESKINNIFNRKNAYGFKSVLAEGYARILEQKDISLARDIIDRTIDRVQKQGSEVLKQCYAFSSLISTLVILILIFLIRLYKSEVLMVFDNDHDIYDILLTILFGGIGAYIFTTLRLKQYKPEIVISKGVHIWDGILRIFYGMIGGLLVSIAIKSNIAFGFLNKGDKNFYVTVFLGTIAGASEGFIPSLIKQIEAKTGNSHPKTPKPRKVK
jgi:hypothetical protein